MFSSRELRNIGIAILEMMNNGDEDIEELIENASDAVIDLARELEKLEKRRGDYED